MLVGEVVNTTFEQDPPNHKIVGSVCLHPRPPPPPPGLTLKDGVFIA